MGYITLEEEILMWPFRFFLEIEWLISKEYNLCCRVDIPVDSLCSDYIESEKQRKHNNYLKIRKAAKRGEKITLMTYSEAFY